jgi:hypothetical protein
MAGAKIGRLLLFMNMANINWEKKAPPATQTKRTC